MEFAGSVHACVRASKCVFVSDNYNNIFINWESDALFHRDELELFYFYININKIMNSMSVKYLYIFHSNVDGYECHSDGLQEVLSKSSINFDVVCLSETSQQSDHVYLKNVNYENYHYPFSTTTKSRKGGVDVYLMYSVK